MTGVLAMYHHGDRRFTEEIEILVTKATRREIHRQLTGEGYQPALTRSKHLRDAVSG